MSNSKIKGNGSNITEKRPIASEELFIELYNKKKLKLNQVIIQVIIKFINFYQI